MDAPPAHAEYPYSVIAEQHGRSQALVARNDGPMPINLVVELTQAVNTGFSPVVIGSKFTHYLEPGDVRTLTHAIPMKRGRPAHFAFRTRISFGSPRAQHDPVVVYRVPFADGNQGVLFSMIDDDNGRTLGQNANVLSFRVAVATPVVAARPGIVVDVSDVGDKTSERRALGNFVKVLHSDGTWAEYGWLADGSIPVKPKDIVTEGQVLGAVGPHPRAVSPYLHFAVMRSIGGMESRSVSIRMQSATSGTIDPHLFSGPISPDLKPAYPMEKITDEAWRPSEALLPTPDPMLDEIDERLSPAQRQARYREIMLNRADAGGAAIGDSPIFVGMAFVAIILAILSLLTMIIGSGDDEPSGIRGVLWRLIRGRQPHGPMGLSLISEGLGAVLDVRRGAPTPEDEMASRIVQDRALDMLSALRTQGPLHATASEAGSPDAPVVSEATPIGGLAAANG